jgi:uncharacterized DUF497 family protein
MATIHFGDFEWDAVKAATNANKHGVLFEEAVSAFGDANAIDARDRFIADRFVLIGRSARDRVLFVVHAVRSHGRIRIISARKASPAQRKAYENAR